MLLLPTVLQFIFQYLMLKFIIIIIIIIIIITIFVSSPKATRLYLEISACTHLKLGLNKYLH